jgi:hypothetical protein
MSMETRKSIGERPELALWVAAVVLAVAEFGLNAVQAVQVESQVVSLLAGSFGLAVPAME